MSDQFAEPWKRQVLRRIVAGAPEGSLYRGVLEHAVRDYVRGRDAQPVKAGAPSARQRNFLVAKEWLFGPPSREDLVDCALPLQTVCLFLGVSVAEVRKFCSTLTEQELTHWLRSKAAAEKHRYAEDKDG